MSNEDILIICAIFAVWGLWRVAAALHAIAEAVKVAVPRNWGLTWTSQREREPWENN